MREWREPRPRRRPRAPEGARVVAFVESSLSPRRTKGGRPPGRSPPVSVAFPFHIRDRFNGHVNILCSRNRRRRPRKRVGKRRARGFERDFLARSAGFDRLLRTKCPRHPLALNSTANIEKVDAEKERPCTRAGFQRHFDATSGFGVRCSPRPASAARPAGRLSARVY